MGGHDGPWRKGMVWSPQLGMWFGNALASVDMAQHLPQRLRHAAVAAMEPLVQQSCWQPPVSSQQVSPDVSTLCEKRRVCCRRADCTQPPVPGNYGFCANHRSTRVTQHLESTREPTPPPCTTEINKRRKLTTVQRDPVHRQKLTTVQRDTVAHRQKWCCAYCKSLLPVSYQIDHTCPLFAGGQDSTENMQALCANCHVVKTATERAVIASLGNTTLKVDQ